MCKTFKCHEVLELPFPKISMDLAEYGRKIYLIVVDYLSKCGGIEKLIDKDLKRVLDNLVKAPLKPQ